MSFLKTILLTLFPIFLIAQPIPCIESLEVHHIEKGKSLGTIWGHVLLVVNTNIGSYAYGIQPSEFNKFTFLKMICGSMEVKIQKGFTANLHQEYLSKGQNISIYRVPYTEYDIIKTLERLDSLLKDPKHFGNYSFFSNDCATIISKILVRKDNKNVLVNTPWEFKTKL